MKDYKIISAYHEEMETDKWVNEIPYIKFPKEWRVKITPGFGGAIIRFRIAKDKAEVSVYLDCYDQLGCYGSPYWEIYPVDDDVHRVRMNEIDRLLMYISLSIKQQNNH